MATKFFYVCAGLLMLALAYHLGAGSARGQASASLNQAGGWQFIIKTAENTGASGYLFNASTGELWAVDSAKKTKVVEK